jgi:hypothetical protein
LICSPDCFKQTFASSLSDNLHAYKYTPKENTFYAAQVCLHPSSRGKNHFKQLLDGCVKKAVEKGAEYFLAEILANNQRSRKVCEKNRWVYIAEKDSFLDEFKGIDSSETPKIPITWTLYELNLQQYRRTSYHI